MDLPGHEGEELPIPITSTFATAHGHAPFHPSNGLFTTPAAAAATTTTTIAEEASSCNRRKGVAMVTYRECLRNHAAAIGGSALDGCGEFMPSGEEGTLEDLKCSACSCHRNFHRKEVDLHHHHYHHHLMGRKVVGHHKGVLISASTDGYGYSLQARPATQMVMPLGALQASDYYWDQDMEGAGAGGLGLDRGAPVGKKRFRTKFTPEQKEKMLSFAEKVGWRLQNQEDALVQEFCKEVGVKRRVLKVWMHNNKHTLAQKAAPPLQLG